MPWCSRIAATIGSGSRAFFASSTPSLTCAAMIERAHRGLEPVVAVVPLRLVLDEVVGHLRLADVVVVAGHARQQRVRADRLRRGLREVSQHERVLVGAGRLERESAQKRQVLVRQLEQADVGRDVRRGARRREGGVRPASRRTSRPPTSLPARRRAKFQPHGSAFRKLNRGDRDEVGRRDDALPSRAARCARAACRGRRCRRASRRAAKSAKGKLCPMSTPAPTAWTAAKSSAGPIPATRLVDDRARPRTGCA